MNIIKKEDPNPYIKLIGKNNFNKALNNAMSLPDFLFFYLLKKINIILKNGLLEH